jgi:hypothetical protein
VNSYFNLSNRYERKARFLPALLSLLPALSAVFAYAPQFDLVQALATSVGIGAAVGILLSHVASAMGNRLQRKLWPDWPHDAPTHRWLQPADETVSQQQKGLWYRQAWQVTGIDLEQAIAHGPAETRGAVNDVVRSVRNQLRGSKMGIHVEAHNIDFGFARNLTGLRPVLVLVSLISMAACWGGHLRLGHPLMFSVAATIVWVAVCYTAWLLPRYVIEKSTHYADSFFAALSRLGDTVDKKREVYVQEAEVEGVVSVIKADTEVPAGHRQ